MSAPSATTSASLTKGLLFLMAMAVAATAANLYYNQPILPSIGLELGLSDGQLGYIPAASQLGYAAAILLISPLGDVLVRKKIIAILSLCLVVSSLVAFSSHHFVLLIVACFGIGLSANITQQLIPFAASMSTAQEKGRVIGTLMTGLTVGILLSRTLSGWVGELWGWRAVFLMSALIAAVFGVLLYRRLPHNTPPAALPYGQLLASMLTLVRQHTVLRQSALTGALWFAAFNALWATLALHVSKPPFGYDAHQAGLFGLVAMAGVIGAKVSGRLVPKLGAPMMINIALLLIASGFAVTYFYADQLVGLVIGIILIDLGVFSAQVSNQVRVFSIDPKAQSRINGVYMLGYYLGGAVGSYGGVQLFDQYGWSGVSGLAIALLAISALVNNLHRRQSGHD
ncbi:MULTISPECIES: MFS transporter [unclassified Vibrio]|uniref:MFS transporter n=1 Tax=Vibrio sp. HB236076 TaxID=3232307 RepID=A0AB39HGI8_9VIBR|nr:MFS transporter [Vibrio sp. HB161653]MDP5255262.1 MFS transporter [Vibrio sp. HB161653]